MSQRDVHMPIYSINTKRWSCRRKRVSYEDFWQRYYYRCPNINCIMPQLIDQADAQRAEQRAAAVRKSIEDAQQCVVW